MKRILRLNPVIYLILFVIIFYFSYLICNYKIVSSFWDFVLHIEWIYSFKEGNLEVAHPFLYLVTIALSTITSISIENSMALIITFSILISIYTTQILISHYIKDKDYLVLLYSIILNLIIPLYLPGLDLKFYIGVSSPTIWHSPTYTIMKPFVIYAVYCFIILIENLKLDTKTSNLKIIKSTIILSVMLVLSTISKPSFVFVFIPTVIIVMILNYKKFVLKHYLIVGLSFIPTLLVLLSQYFFMYGDNDSSIIISPFSVWNLFSNNLFLSILRVILIPIALYIGLRKRIVVKNNIVMQICVVQYIFALLTTIVLAESGQRFEHSNFFWGYSISIFFLYLYIMIEYLKNNNTEKNIWISIGRVFIAIQFLEGIIYFLLICFNYGYQI